MSSNQMNRLCELVTPPTNPNFNLGDWRLIENELGLALPDEYKHLIEVFGQGEFAGSDEREGLFISSYLMQDHVFDRANGFSMYYRELLEFVDVPYGIFPEKPGLLGFGTFAGSHEIAWHTSGRPSTWNIVYHTLESGFQEIPSTGTVSFIISMLDGTSSLYDSGVVWKGGMAPPYTFKPGW